RRFAGRLLHRRQRPDRERPRWGLATLRPRVTLYPGDQTALPRKDVGALSKVLRFRSRMGFAEQANPAQPDSECRTVSEPCMTRITAFIFDKDHRLLATGNWSTVEQRAWRLLRDLRKRKKFRQIAETFVCHFL